MNAGVRAPHGAVVASARSSAGAALDFHAVDLCVRHPASAPDSPCVLDGLSLDIRHGEQVAVIGASGAGKSTLLATLALAREPHEGTLEAFGVAPWSLTSAERHRLRRRLFLAPQLPPLPPRQRVVDAVLAGRVPRWGFATAVGSLFHPKEAGLARSALQRFGLDDKLFHRVDRLSGGERQRVALARMLAANVDAFLVDEPLSALDPALAGRSIAVLQDVARERGATLVCSLHQVELAHALFPRIVGLRAGRIVFDRSRAEVDAALLDGLYAERPAPTEGAAAESPRARSAAPDDEVAQPDRIADGSLL